MPDYKFIQNPITKEWVMSAPRRAKRPNIGKETAPEICPFCPGSEATSTEILRVSPRKPNGSISSEWQVRVINNKYPFTPIHEVVIHSPDHDKSFEDFSLHQIELIVKIFKNRYLEHQDKGQVYIFHNRGKKAGESITHSHTQIVVVPDQIKLNTPKLDPDASVGYSPHALQLYTDHDLDDSLRCMEKEDMIETPNSYMFCPASSNWPDEVWFAPKERMHTFGEITDTEIADFSYTLQRLIQIFKLRHQREFPFNFYIHPGRDWYLRIIPRIKVLGGFEVGTGVFVNTQDPKETIKFIKDHFEAPNIAKILAEDTAEYSTRV
ncbi:hypothetical protein KKG52_00165 [Patescibacteria group bacterium]|nr:hypothetical protein [Patescibacteria group bacterium]